MVGFFRKIWGEGKDKDSDQQSSQQSVDAVDADELQQTEPESIPVAAKSSGQEKKKSFFSKLRDKLSKTKSALIEKVRAVIRLHGGIDEELLEEIEEILIQSDVGVAATQKIVDRMRKEARKEAAEGGDALVDLFKRAIEEILLSNHRALDLETASPLILLMVGVNGSGKTTTIGKIAKAQTDLGKKVMLVAADTFRAAATEQLAIWAKRANAHIVRKEEGSDPSAVVFEAMELSREMKPDLILIDTAGRLHTKTNLMEELKKMIRVIRRHYAQAPHEIVLTLDATTGQNAVNQVRIFNEACDLSGLIITKLDGTAKGGVLIACKEVCALPVFKIGIGESAEDLRDFDPHDFVEALFGSQSEDETN